MEFGIRWIGQQGINSHKVLSKHLGHDIRLEHEKYPDVTAIYVFCSTCTYAIMKIDKLGYFQVAKRMIQDEVL